MTVSSFDPKSVKTEVSDADLALLLVGARQSDRQDFGFSAPEIRDLAGRLVREVYNGFDVAGRHVRRWDGRDGQGQQVGPGVYICRVETKTEEGRRQRSGVVAVAY